MNVGDIVVRKSYDKDITFKIIDIKSQEDKTIYVLKGINLRIIADAPEEDLVRAKKGEVGKVEHVFNDSVNKSINNILRNRQQGVTCYRQTRKYTSRRQIDKNELSFGRPGRVLHIDGDAEYLEVCLKTYKQLAIEAVGVVIPESQQPRRILELLKKVKPDIVVITGHDSIIKGTDDYMNLNNYKNSKYFVETVAAIRNYESDYDDLVIFAGACQSCYELILDAGAN